MFRAGNLTVSWTYWCKRAAAIVFAAAVTCQSVLLPALAISGAEKRWLKLERTGSAALDANEFWIAEPALKHALIQAESFAPDDIRVAKSLGELGRLYTVRGRFLLAQSYLEQELAVRQAAPAAANGKIVPAMASLICFYLNYGSAIKAVPLTEEMLSIVEGKLKEPLAGRQAKLTLKKGMPLGGWCGLAAPPMHDQLIEWAIACDAAGGAHLKGGNEDMAERLFKAALDLKATVLGKHHLSLANSYESLGAICLKKNEKKDAESYFRDALAITEQVLPPDSLEVYNRLDKLARCLARSGKYHEAEKLYIHALSCWQNVPAKYGNDARALYCLGSLYVDEKKYAAAAPVLQRALRAAEKNSGPLSIILVPYLQRYAYDLYYLGRRRQTMALRARSCTISGGMPANTVQLRAPRALKIKNNLASARFRVRRHGTKLYKQHNKLIFARN